MSSETTVLDTDFSTPDFDPRDLTVAAGVRFGNYLLDILFFYVIVFLIGIALAVFGVQIPTDDKGLQLVALLLLFLYYFIFEATMGKTPAKFITRCRVVNDKGRLPDVASIAGRSLSRFVPFDAFTFLGGDARGWHDRWSNTWVISEKKLSALKSGLKSLTGEFT